MLPQLWSEVVRDKPGGEGREQVRRAQLRLDPAGSAGSAEGF